jgi:hypothetical protein
MLFHSPFHRNSTKFPRISRDVLSLYIRNQDMEVRGEKQIEPIHDGVDEIKTSNIELGLGSPHSTNGDKIRVFDLEALRSPVRKGSFDTEFSVRGIDPAFYVDPNRSVQRSRVLNRINNRSAPTSGEPLTAAEQGKALLELSNEAQAAGTFEFSRFERLCLLNIYLAQHRLTQLDEKIEYELQGDLSDGNEEVLQKGLQNYRKSNGHPNTVALCSLRK